VAGHGDGPPSPEGAEGIRLVRQQHQAVAGEQLAVDAGIGGVADAQVPSDVDLTGTLGPRP